MHISSHTRMGCPVHIQGMLLLSHTCMGILYMLWTSKTKEQSAKKAIAGS